MVKTKRQESKGSNMPNGTNAPRLVDGAGFCWTGVTMGSVYE